MATDVEISSSALDRLGDEPISSFLEGSGPLCSRLFPDVKFRVLTSAPWRMTMKKSELLNRTLIEPPTQYKFEYQLPSDMLTDLPRTVWNSTFNSGRGTPYTDFDIFADKLLTSTEQVLIDYQVDLDPDLFPPHLNQLTIYAMCAELAFPITDQQSVADAWLKIAWGTPEQRGKGGYFKEAQRIDSQGHPSQAIKNYPLTAVRHAGGGF